MRCPEEVWSGGDIECTISYTGSEWYSGDWVALHYNKETENLWVNGYTPNNVDCKVRVVNAVSGKDSPWGRGGTGVGLSVGGFVFSDIRAGSLIYAGGKTLTTAP
ncbi:hypothetical protein [Streptomyces sp. NPDC048473]|uniref:hypothetical protein n=1 Tax=unclassified Streptomyces TaxID=2593676 RepID=UPI00371BCD92